jgi:DNA (cytosine-5)-methyltransferase 1
MSQQGLDFGRDELIIDNFAGGGGASLAIEAALGRSIDIAINHDAEALAMHAVNHPRTLHLCEDVWAVNIQKVVAGRKIGLAWFSPDCKHFSIAKGGKPVEKKIRGLAWVALRWAAKARPRVIILENVREFKTWGPLVDGLPCPRRKGMTFKRWVTQLRNLGYTVDWRELSACDYGAPTIRKRLFIVARCDGQAIEWPVPTHGPGRLAYRTAAECIDWSLPCPSIFLTRKEGRAIGVNRPLADATMRRIARGVKRYVLEAADPFIVSLTHQGGDRCESVDEPFKTVTGAKRGEKALVVPYLTEHANGSTQRNFAADEPLRTQCAEVKRGHFALISPMISSFYGAKSAKDVRGAAVNEPLDTQPTENRHALVAAFLAKHFGGHETPGSSVDAPASTITSIDHHALVASHLVKLRGTCRDGQPVTEPMATVSAGGTHIGEVRAFLIKYFGTDQDPRLGEPMHTVTSKDRFGLVMVKGEEYIIVDIGMRMLTPRELFRAQGFSEDYIIDRGIKVSEPGATDTLFKVDVELTKTAQIRMCGNSVSPPPAEALVRSQFLAKTTEAVA